MFTSVAAEARIDPRAMAAAAAGRRMKERRVLLDEAASPRGERSPACARRWKVGRGSQ